jgi:UDP-glucose 4-epimerase
MRALVTGGLGFVGSNLVDRLLEKEWTVYVIDDMSSGSFMWKNDGVIKYFHFDVELINQKFCEDVDVIFHLAAEARIQPSFEKPYLWQRSNVLGTAAVCEFARNNGCKVVYAGSSSCYGGKFMNPYTFSKKIGEEVCEMYSKVFGLSTVTARFFNVYGPRNPLIGEFTPIIAKFEQLKSEGLPLTVVGDGEQRRDFTHVLDICDGLIRLAEDEWCGELFNFGTGVNYSINQIVDFFESEKVLIPARPGESRETKANIKETKKILGWKPKYKLKNYIKEIIK